MRVVVACVITDPALAYRRHFLRTRLNRRADERGYDRGTQMPLRQRARQGMRAKSMRSPSRRATGDAVIASCARRA